MLVNFVAIISNFTLIGLGTWWMYNHCGWFAAAVTLAIALISGANMTVYVGEFEE